MKLAILANESSIHTIKWANEMADRGHEVYLISLRHNSNLPMCRKNVRQYLLPFPAPIGYYLNCLFLRSVLSKIQPDLLHTHYASGYGTLGRLSGFHPNLLSVWGSDVFEFPYQSKLKMRIIQLNILNADQLSSTSWIMKEQTELIQKPKKDIKVIPFGVDCKQFSPKQKPHSEILRIGTIKTLEETYGISTLIRAFSILKKQLMNTELIIIGSGSQESELKRLTNELKLEDSIKFIGSIEHSDVPKWLNSFDIFVALSNSESFGVAVLEASACGLPVLVSDVGGLPEVVINGSTGFVIPKQNSMAAADKLLQMATNNALRERMGSKGRDFVVKNYEWGKCADQMEDLYKQVIRDV